MLSKSERDMMIEWLMVSQGCAYEYWNKMSDDLILLNYRENVLPDPSEAGG